MHKQQGHELWGAPWLLPSIECAAFGLHSLSLDASARVYQTVLNLLDGITGGGGGGGGATPLFIFWGSYQVLLACQRCVCLCSHTAMESQRTERVSV